MCDVAVKIVYPVYDPKVHAGKWEKGRVKKDSSKIEGTLFKMPKRG